MTILRNLIAVLVLILGTQTLTFAQANFYGFGQQTNQQQYTQQAGILAQVGHYSLSQTDVQVVLQILELSSGQALNPAMQQMATQQLLQQFYLNPAGMTQEIQACYQIIALAVSGGMGQQQQMAGYTGQAAGQNFDMDGLMYGGYNPFSGQQAVDFGAFQGQMQQQQSDFQMQMDLDQQYLDDYNLQQDIQYDYNNEY